MATFVLLLRDHALLNAHRGSESVLVRVSAVAGYPVANPTPEPGHEIGHRLAWVGFAIMLLTVPFTFRKRVKRLRGVGTIRGWLDFHIFTGLWGPLIIVFHTNLKLGGLVSVAFWSMVICVVSGVAGKYLLTIVSRQQRAAKDPVRQALARRTAHLMGYWQDFHTPFAIVMWIVVAIHIGVAVTFQVN